jgi:hypothetical protein
VLKMVSAGLTALVVVIATSVLSYAESPSDRPLSQRITADDLNALTDARIALVKAALQPTSEQEKYWPAIEEAIRSRAKGRQTRLQGVIDRADERSEVSPIVALRDRNPVEFLKRRSDALAQRAAELKKLADAWQPLYGTLSPDQRRRLGFVAVATLRELRDAAEQRRIQRVDDED